MIIGSRKPFKKRDSIGAVRKFMLYFCIIILVLKVSNLNLLDLDFAEVVLFQNALCHDSATKLEVIIF